MALLFYIDSKVGKIDKEKKDKYFDKVISNIKRLQALEFKSFNLDVFSDDIFITLEGNPKGKTIKKPLQLLFYEEENFFTDGYFKDSYNEIDGVVDVSIKKA